MVNFKIPIACRKLISNLPIVKLIIKLIIMEGTIGEIRMFASNFAPKSWAYCDGSILAIRSNTALFSILGTVYGGNGTTTFALPDLRGRTAVGVGVGPGLSSYTLGEVSGAENQTMTTSQMPAHIHGVSGNLSIAQVSIPAFNGEATTTEPSETNFPAISNGANIYADSPTPNAFMGPIQATITASDVTVGNTGGNLAFSIQPPYAVINYVICLIGVFPARD